MLILYKLDLKGGLITMKEEISMTLRIPKDLKEKIVAEAEAEQRSQHNLILYILSNHYKELENSKAKS